MILLSRRFPLSPNSPCCRRFCDFINSTVLDWISQGVIKVHGVVGACSPPHLVLPLTVEPTTNSILQFFLEGL